LGNRGAKIPHERVLMRLDVGIPSTPTSAPRHELSNSCPNFYPRDQRMLSHEIFLIHCSRSSAISPVVKRQIAEPCCPGYQLGWTLGRTPNSFFATLSSAIQNYTSLFHPGLVSGSCGCRQRSAFDANFVANTSVFGLLHTV
jgi:hypothetical protein